MVPVVMACMHSAEVTNVLKKVREDWIPGRKCLGWSPSYDCTLGMLEMPVTYDTFCGTLQAPKEKSHVLQMTSPWGLACRIVCLDKFSLSLLPLSFLSLGVVIITLCHCILEVCNFLTSQELTVERLLLVSVEILCFWTLLRLLGLLVLA